MFSQPPGGGNAFLESGPFSQPDKLDNKIILIKPRDVNLIASPLKIANMLNKSPFKKFVVDTSVHKRLAMIVVMVKSGFNESNLDSIKTIDGHEVECTIKAREPSLRYGVIQPVSLDTNLEELKQMIEIDGDGEVWNGQLIEVTRLKRKAGLIWVDSQSLRLGFSGKDLPKGVKIGYSYYRVSPYVRAPLQCYNCQRMGHTAANCKSLTRCMLCGSNHKKQDCTMEDSTLYKCANCQGNHRSNDPVCAQYRQAREVELLRSTQNMTFQEARKSVIQRNRSYNSASPTRSDSYSYAQILRSQVPVDEPGSSASLACTSGAPAATHSNLSIPELLSTLTKCLLEILNEILPKSVEKTNLETIIGEKVNSHFNKRKISVSSVSSSSGMDGVSETETPGTSRQVDLNNTMGKNAKKNGKNGNKKIKEDRAPYPATKK